MQTSSRIATQCTTQRLRRRSLVRLVPRKLLKPNAPERGLFLQEFRYVIRNSKYYGCHGRSVTTVNDHGFVKFHVVSCKHLCSYVHDTALRSRSYCRGYRGGLGLLFLCCFPILEAGSRGSRGRAALFTAPADASAFRVTYQPSNQLINFI